MKRFLWFLLLAGATAISAYAQSAVITGPSNPISASGTVTVTGTASGAATVSVSVTYLPTGLSVTVSGATATVTSGVWSATFTPAALGDYFVRATIPWEAAFLAGKAFAQYKRRTGTKRSPLPDFFIGAHAAVAGMTLLTRDPRRYRTYFPKLRLVSP